jgi:hypothetical protein
VTGTDPPGIPLVAMLVVMALKGLICLNAATPPTRRPKRAPPLGSRASGCPRK